MSVASLHARIAAVLTKTDPLAVVVGVLLVMSLWLAWPYLIAWWHGEHSPQQGL